VIDCSAARCSELMRTSFTRARYQKLSHEERCVYLDGAALATACGAVAETGEQLNDDVGDQFEAASQLGEAITGNWTTLTLVNGWQNYNSVDAPAIGVVNGVVRFRGAMKGTNATSDAAFLLPSQFRPYFTNGGVVHNGSADLNMRTVLANSTGGSLWYERDAFGGQSATHDMIHVQQDGVSGVGASGKVFTSLDGVSFDRSIDNSTPLQMAEGWGSLYGLRQDLGSGAYVKLVDGFVRFQGAMTGNPGVSGYLFTLPTQFRPGQTVYVPVNLCADIGQKYGRLNVYSNGDVVVQGDMTAARCRVSLEGASFSLTGGGTSLTLLNSWIAYSPRAVKVRLNDGVVRFEGAIKSGTSGTIAQLAQNMRPARTVYLTSDSWSATQGRIYVTSAGNVVVEYPALATSSGFTSLDGLSFSL
jgi:hypothetical protein